MARVAVFLACVLVAVSCSSPKSEPAPAGDAGKLRVEVAPSSGEQTVQATPDRVGPSDAADWRADGVVTVGEYVTSQQQDGYEISWRSDEQYVYVGMKAKTDGWVAVGFKPSFGMKDADIVFGFVDDGAVTVMDMMGTAPTVSHPADVDRGGTDDILEYGGTESGGFTTIEFKRRLVTGDGLDQELLPGPNQIIWAYGSGDSPSLRHSKRGSSQIIIGR